MGAGLILPGERLSALGAVEHSYAASPTVGKVGCHYLLITVGTGKVLPLFFLLFHHSFPPPFFFLLR